MGGIGGMELLIVGLVALIVVGPKDLPGMFRTIGQFTGKAKRMAREFSNAMEAAADDAGVGDVAKTLKSATDTVSNPKKMGLDAVKKAIDPGKFEEGSSTQKLAADRAEATKKIQATSAKAAEARAARDAAAAKGAAESAGASAGKAKPAAKPKAAAKPKTAAKPKPAAKPKAAAKPATKTTTKTGSKPAAKKPAARKPAAKKA